MKHTNAYTSLLKLTQPSQTLLKLAKAYQDITKAYSSLLKLTTTRRVVFVSCGRHGAIWSQVLDAKLAARLLDVQVKEQILH